jgi:alkyl hydroperoxide reductase subunit AhpC
MERQWNQLAGLFLIDRTGIIRWVFVEATEGAAGIGKYAPEAQIVVLAQTLLR